MDNNCLMHSITIHDLDNTFKEVLYLSNTIFSLECAKKGYKYKTNNGKMFDTSQYNITYDKHSDLKGNIHYIAQNKDSEPLTSCTDWTTEAKCNQKIGTCGYRHPQTTQCVWVEDAGQAPYCTCTP